MHNSNGVTYLSTSAIKRIANVYALRTKYSDAKIQGEPASEGE